MIPPKLLIKEKKNALREDYRQARREMSPEEKAARDKAICDAACSMASFRYAEYVLMYASTEEEIDVYPIARRALELGKKVAFPLCRKQDRTMSYHIVTSLDELASGAYGITEPPKDTPIYDPSKDLGSAICFVPGLVYDREGYRLGYGKGFYDRYLSAFSGCTIGVVYSDYILKTVPRGRFDVKVDILLTEKGVKMTSEA